MSQQQGATPQKDKHKGTFTFLIGPAVFLFLFLQGDISPAGDPLSGFISFLWKSFWYVTAGVLLLFAHDTLDERCSGEVQIWVTAIIVVAVGALYAFNCLPGEKYKENYYEGYRAGYYAGFDDAADHIRPAFNAGMQAQIDIIQDPEDYTAEGLYERWENDADMWDWESDDYDMTAKEFYQEHGPREGAK